MSLRVASVSDADAITALLGRSYPVLLAADYAPEVLSVALPLMVTAQPALLDSGSFYVWDMDGAILGAGGWTPDKTQADKGHIRHVVTDPAHLRSGIAKALIVHCLVQAQAAEIKEVECWSTRGAVRFYEALGFGVEAHFDVMLDGTVAFPSVRMRRTI